MLSQHNARQDASRSTLVVDGAAASSATPAPELDPPASEDAPALLRCPRCGRTCMDLDAHKPLCADHDAEPAFEQPRKPSRRPQPTVSHAWDERPATSRAENARRDAEWTEKPESPQLHEPCPNCGRRFTPERLLVHRRACAGQTLPGYRAVVQALERTDREEELLRRAAEAATTAIEHERSRTAAEQRRAEAAEARATAAEAAVAEASKRLEREKAAAKSLEAAYDVMAEAVEDGKQREAELRRQLDEAEAVAAAATAKAEREKAAAKSLEAAYDVMTEAVDDGKKREAELRRQLEKLEGTG